MKILKADNRSAERVFNLCNRGMLMAFLICLISFLLAFFIPTFYPGVPFFFAGTFLVLIFCFLHSLVIKGVYHSIVFLVISLVFTWFTEFIGCNYSLWFGDYEYTDALGPMIGNVPVFIVIMWEAIIYPSHILVDWLTGQSGRPYADRISKGILPAAVAASATAIIVTAWDMMVDPMSVHLKFWTWDFGGPYFREIAGGVPLSNYWGWFGAVFIISFVYRLFFAQGQKYNNCYNENPVFPIAAYSMWYLIIGYLMIHLDIILPLFITTFTMGPVIVIAWKKYLTEVANMKFIS